MKRNVELNHRPPADVDLEGTPVQGPLRHWFPVTIVSLELAILKKCPPSKTVEKWDAEFKSRLVPPAISLLSYGRGKINTVGS